jgi:UDP-N-acetylmuramate--alanine ligase
MIDIQAIKRAHCIGIGGIHVSAIARLLKSRAVNVSGSDAVAGDETKMLESEGIRVTIGHGAQNITQDADVVIYSHAVQESNPELVEAKRLNIPAIDTHSFLAQSFADAEQIVVTGTHGKSTTTALLGSAVAACGGDPTVVVGTRVPGFDKGNLRLGSPNLLVVEGDEYRSHVLSYSPFILVFNNAELDHTDIFPTLEAYLEMFGKAIDLVRDGGSLIYNAEDDNVASLVSARGTQLAARKVNVVSVGLNTGDVRFTSPTVKDGRWNTRITLSDKRMIEVALHIPGEMNARNAAMAAAAVVAWKPDADIALIAQALADFRGCWRRFENVGTFNGATVISDYGHHPSEVRETLKAARTGYAGQRLVLCYQPHQHARTKGLFKDFVQVLAEPDVLILAEIYDVPGREEEKDADVTGQTLANAIGPKASYAKDLDDAEMQLRQTIRPNNVVLVMGAGTIDQVARRLVASK